MIGGGISGLAAAHRLVERARAAGRPLTIHLWEARPRLGGIIETRRERGYLVECGPDMFITDKPWGVELCRRLGLETELITPEPRYRRTLVVRDGRVLPVPSGFQLMAPTDLWSFLRSPVLSWSGKLRVMCEAVLPPRRSPSPTSPAAAADGPVADADAFDDESLGAFVRRRFGAEALDRLVQPLVAGIYTADADQLSLAATMPRFLEMERRHGSVIRGLLRERRQRRRRGQAVERSSVPEFREGPVRPPTAASDVEAGSGARYELFVTLRDGLQRLVDVLAERLEGNARLHVGRCATAVQRMAMNDAAVGGRSGYRVTTDDGSVEVDALLLAVPAYRAADLLQRVHGTLAEALRTIEYASSVVVVSAHAEADFAHPLDAYGLVVPRIEDRPILAVSFASRKFPGRAPAGHVLLRTFLGGALQPELCQRSDAELRDIALGQLRELLGLRREPDFAWVVRHERAMPQYTLGHPARVAKIDSFVRSLPGLALAGSAFRGVGIPDSIHSGQQAAEKVWRDVCG
ncbi:MAG: protoporphyrinogen oxidase [Planctomycetota bacterium]|nr:MAG: protoporphyrinogen oxidase [Planctomycetota bacterium]